MIIHLDFETYSECDLKECGAWVYSRHPSTEVLCMAYAINEGHPVLWTPDMPLPIIALESIINMATYKAWNTFFEYCIWYNTLKWPVIPIQNWDNTQAHAMASALPRALGDCAEVLGLAVDKQKDKRGKYLIQKLCKPYRGRRIQDKALLDELYDYCKQDVVVERTLSDILTPKTSITQTERKLWEVDFKMNTQGLPIDTQLVNAAIDLYHQEFSRLKTRLEKITQLANPNSNKQFLDWLHLQSVFVDNTQATTLKALLADDLPEQVKEAITLRLQTAKTPVAKYEAIANRTSLDNRLRGFQLYHAATTGRFSSTGVNFQNLPRPTIEDIDDCITLMRNYQHDELRSKHTDIMEVLSSSIRGVIQAPEGKMFYLADYSAIEARVLAWLAGQDDALEIFRTHGKIYEQAAANIYRVELDEVTKPQRTVGKVAVLALGYQGGYRAFQKMATIYNVDISDNDAKEIVAKWRRSNHAITGYWELCNNAAIQAIHKPFTTYEANLILFRSDGNQLWAKLPSGRKLTWNKPCVVDGQLGYKGVEPTSGKWVSFTTYGGDIVQSLTQAVARDVMANAMLALDAEGFELRLTVHDEIVVETERPFDEFMKIMNTPPAWAKRLPIKAEGEICTRYKK